MTFSPTSVSQRDPGEKKFWEIFRVYPQDFRFLVVSSRARIRVGTAACSHKRKFALPKDAVHCSLNTWREKPIKIGAKMVRHGRYVTFQMAEVAVSRRMFGQILARIARLRAPPAPA